MKHTESTIQGHCVAWFRWQYPAYRALLFAIPNGAHLAGDARQRRMQYMRLVREGFVPGVADLFLAVPGEKPGLFIEMKTEKGRQRPEQVEFQKAVTESGYGYEVCRSLDQFQKVVKKHLCNK